MNYILSLLLLFVFTNSVFSYNLPFFKFLCNKKNYISRGEAIKNKRNATYIYTKELLDKKAEDIVSGGDRNNRNKKNNYKLIDNRKKNDSTLSKEITTIKQQVVKKHY